jgi:hypothetical protein
MRVWRSLYERGRLGLLATTRSWQAIEHTRARAFVVLGAASSHSTLIVAGSLPSSGRVFAMASLAVVVMCFADRKCGIVFADIATSSAAPGSFSKSSFKVKDSDTIDPTLRTSVCCFDITTN